MQDKKDDDLVIDFSKITNFFRKGKKGKGSAKHEDGHVPGSHTTASHIESDSDIDKHSNYSDEATHKKRNVYESDSDDEKFNFDDVKHFTKKYGIPLLILIPIILSIVIRIQPYYLPVTDTWAEQTVIANYRANIEEQVDMRYPNLPEADKSRVVQEQLANAIANDESYHQTIEWLSNSYKSRMQDENGQTYLFGIDPYLWYGQAKNYVRTGNFGNEINDDGDDWYSLRNGRVGVEAGTPMHSIATVVIYRIGSIFNKDFTIMGAAFISPVILMLFGIFPVFFLVRKFAGDVGGFFAAMLYTIHPGMLSRTIAGFSDTDVYTIIFPLIAFWLFFEAIDAKSKRNSMYLLGGAGLTLAVMSVAWGGWWYTFGFILATLGAYLVYYMILNFNKIRGDFMGFVKGERVGTLLRVFLSISISFIVFRGILSFFFDRTTNIFIGFKHLYYALIEGPIWFINIKEVAGVTLWPNVFTTVAELNPATWSQIVSSLGGTLLFGLSVFSILLLLIKRKGTTDNTFKFGLLLAIWYGATIFASLTSVRFIAILTPAFALALGSGIGIMYYMFSDWMSRGLNVSSMITKPAMILVFMLLLISPMNTAWGTARGMVPSYSDAWDASLMEISNRSDDAIITSWWDFGHWFVARSERRVTFDGGDQGNRIHWAGKTLVSDDEDEVVGILRMLNCGQELAYERLNEMTSNDSYGSKKLLDEIVLMDKSSAAMAFLDAGLSEQEVVELIGYTHCEDLIDQYYIVSEDMVGKSGVWAHFGSWDFDRALIFNTVKRMNSSRGIQTLVDRFGYAPRDAEKEYFAILSQTADQWVVGWPSYYSGEQSCEAQGDVVVCPTEFCIDNRGGQCSHWIFAVGINMTTMDTQLVSNQNVALTPVELVYTGEDDIESVVYNESHIQASFALINRDGAYSGILMHPELAKSTFTRLFFFDGLGSRYFREISDKVTFRGERIRVYTVDFEPMERHVPSYGSSAAADMILSDDLIELDIDDLLSEIDNISPE